MSKVFSDLKPRNSVEKNGFDLSRRSVFSAKCGMITPCFSQATLPDSEYQIDVRQLLRTQPLQTAAFTGFSVNYDFFFVPNNYAYSSFNEFISMRSDERHVGQPSNTVIPDIPFKLFLQKLICASIFDYIIDTYYSPRAIFSTLPTARLVPRYCVVSKNMPWTSVALEVIRGLDMFGYGNYLPVVKLYAEKIYKRALGANTSITYVQFCNYLSSLGTSATTFDGIIGDIAVDITNVNQDIDWPSDLFTDLPDIRPTLWPFMSYNKGFYEFYRNVYYDESFNITLCGSENITSYNIDYVQLYNYDDYTYISTAVTNPFFSRFCAMIVPKPHLYKKDLFTGVLPSTQFGDVSVMVDNRDWLNFYARYNASSSTGASLVSSSGSTGLSERRVNVGSNTTQYRFDPGLAISVLEQRRADAMQRFKERLMRAGNKVKDVFKAHGWNEPYSANEAQPVFLGTFDGRLDVNTVAATMGSDTVELGQLGANGTAVVSGSKIRFKCHDFGTIIGVFYIVKDAEYDAYGVEKQNCLTDVYDYPFPELQNISLHPVDVLELSNFLRIASSDRPFTGDIIGYLPRYMEYKTAVDKVHGEFYSAPVSYEGLLEDSPLNSVGVFSDWVTPRQEIRNPTSVSFLYQSPKVVDNVFMQRSTALQSSDQFLINCLFDVMAVEPVSVIGLPI